MRDRKRRRIRAGGSACVDAGCITLDALRGGDEVEVLEVGDENARIHALRFGMEEGSRVQCVTRIPAGPIILKSGRQEVAVGRSLAKRIRVRPVRRGDRRSVA